MVKVSISLPNNAQITFEAEESEVLHGVVGLVLRDLPRDLMQSTSSDGGDANGIIANASTEKSTSVATSSPATATMTAEPVPFPETQPFIQQAGQQPLQQPVESAPPVPTSNQEPAATSTETDGQAPALPTEFLSESGRADFESFCQNANPLGDMRRVVVAAVGANRHFGVDGVNADDLAWLFDVAGWRRPGNFTQTLRNAARSKFGWLERIPDRSGRYAATPLGISKTLTAD